MTRYYLKCNECGERAYAIPEEEGWYFCSNCVRKFYSENLSKADNDKRDWEKELTGYTNQLKETEEMKEGFCKGCGEKKKIICKGLCWKCYDAKRKLKKNGGTTVKNKEARAIREHKKRKDGEGREVTAKAGEYLCSRCSHGVVCCKKSAFDKIYKKVKEVFDHNAIEDIRIELSCQHFNEVGM